MTISLAETSASRSFPPISANVTMPTSIATETEPQESPKWGTCIDSLLRELHAVGNSAERVETAPNAIAIKLALELLQRARRAFPDHPPTSVYPEPSGGLLVEFEFQEPNGSRDTVEWEIANSGAVEVTTYHDDRVVACVRGEG